MQVLSDRFSELHFRLKLTLFKQPLMSRCISIVSFVPPRRTDIPEYSKLLGNPRDFAVKFVYDGITFGRLEPA
ncbi:hypothetical protein COO91_10825 (plasmid) [Nostoc flagelliforme CCNUN1]|uniref:Uncharacterized protein n=1 Tax=Nostoc flagelliforme CCNUN1 TaxID=2038116 RepID=A0A2K8TA58_9NOSO|nr:hypothetical protein [Nostoc flagelliforme]AUB44587.1 hypothetical protein COO91_10825 [Nostoc flagelliforme CCNUN1]